MTALPDWLGPALLGLVLGVCADVASLYFTWHRCRVLAAGRTRAGLGWLLLSLAAPAAAVCLAAGSSAQAAWTAALAVTLGRSVLLAWVRRRLGHSLGSLAALEPTRSER